MANANRKNFTDRMMQDQSVSRRIADIQSEIEARRDEATDLKNQMDLLPVDGVLPGDQKAGDSGFKGEGILLALEQQFYQSAEKGDEAATFAYVLAGYDVDKPRQKTKDTVLHIAASRNARDVVRVLVESGKCDYLMRDGQGRLASEKAYLFGRSPALARLLSIKERQQADREGIKLTRRP